MVYRVEDLMSFTVAEPGKAITCMVCGQVVVRAELDPPPDLGFILDACVEHRRACADTRSK
jgi:hypothetical protein